MNRKFLTLIVFVFSFMFIAACSNNQETSINTSDNNESANEQEEEKFTLTFGHVQPEDHAYHLMAVEFKNKLEELTNNRVEVIIYPAGQLGNESELVEGLNMGTVDISTITSAVSSNFIEDFRVFSLPFLFEDFNHMFTVMDSNIGDNLSQLLEESGYKKLGFVSGGARSLYASEPIHSLPDLQGKKIRVIEDPIYVDTWNELGALATPIAWDDVYLSLEQSVVDGAEGALISYQSMGFYDPSPYVTVIDYIFSWHNFMMSKSKFDSLPTDIQESVLVAAQYAESFERDYVTKVESELLNNLESEHGVTIIYPNDIEDWREAVSPVHEKMAEEIGGIELIEEILNMSN